MAPFWKHWLMIFLGSSLVHCRPKVADRSTDVPPLYEGDMALTKEQVQALGFTRPASQTPDWNEEAQTRGSTRNPRQLWPNGIIPYVISREIDARGRQLIRQSMRDWDKHVCINFKQREEEQAYIKFVYKKGCWSYVGHIGRPQEVSIGRFTEDPPCDRGALTHELGHALGFFHEQSRPDRDKFVKINWHNIRSGTEKNFRKETDDMIDSRGVPYDFGSIMHYSKYAGNNRPGVITIQAVKPSAEIGQRKMPSKLDIQQARLMYKCDEAATGETAYKPQTTGTAGASYPSRPAPGVPPGFECIRKVKKIGSLHRITMVCRRPYSGKTTRHTQQTQTQTTLKET